MFMLSFVFVIAYGLFEPQRISTVFVSFVYTCIAVGDAVIKSGGLESNGLWLRVYGI